MKLTAYLVHGDIGDIGACVCGDIGACVW
jgi:hypothetical protein